MIGWGARGERQMDEETKPKRKAKENPWYRLATISRLRA
jgi:hypothetical protein